MEKDQKIINKNIKKWLFRFVVAGVVVFLITIVFNRYFLDSMIMGTKMRIVEKNIAKQEQKYKADTYGGKTPQETYALFLEALEKKDIELASKYFVLDRQEEYKEALFDVKKYDKWQLMLEDLTQENLKWRQVGETSMVLEIYNGKEEFLTQINFSLPGKILDNLSPISDIWKISSF